MKCGLLCGKSTLTTPYFPTNLTQNFQPKPALTVTMANLDCNAHLFWFNSLDTCLSRLNIFKYLLLQNILIFYHASERTSWSIYYRITARYSRFLVIISFILIAQSIFKNDKEIKYLLFEIIILLLSIRPFFTLSRREWNLCNLFLRKGNLPCWVLILEIFS